MAVLERTLVGYSRRGQEDRAPLASSLFTQTQALSLSLSLSPALALFSRLAVAFAGFFYYA